MTVISFHADSAECFSGYAACFVLRLHTVKNKSVHTILIGVIYDTVGVLITSHFLQCEMKVLFIICTLHVEIVVNKQEYKKHIIADMKYCT